MEKKIVKFEIQQLLPIGMVLIVAGIGIAYGLSVVGDIKTDIATGQETAVCNVTSGIFTGCGADYNASVDSIDALAKIPSKMPLIATVIIAAIIIGILVRYMVVRMT